jgi:hypothetical protein
MSHVVEIQTEIRDSVAVRAACVRLKLAVPVEGKARLFSGEAAGMIVQLPGWQYPIVCDSATGTVRYDNFGGRWGNQKHLDAFVQAYVIEKVKLESRRKGHSVVEQTLSDGSVKLVVNVAGGAS